MNQSLASYVSLLRRDFTEHCNKQLAEIGLSQGMIYFILYVGKHPGCSPKELAEALRMDMGHTARSLTKLQQGGFLAQKTNPRDRRAHMLELTEPGQEAFQMSHRLFEQWEQATLSELSPEDRTHLFSLLKRLSQGKGGSFYGQL